VRDIEPGDEVIVTGTGEHGRVQQIDYEPQAAVVLEDRTTVVLDLGDLQLAGDEAP
jgi:preprotein translocase subunit YajC